MSITVEEGIAIAETIVDVITKAAPAIEKGVVSAEPYVAAIAGMLTGTNATDASVDALLAQLEADSASFQQPLPPDDPAG